MYTLTITTESYDHDVQIDEAVGVERASSGWDFDSGKRDRQYDFEDRNEAMEAGRRAAMTLKPDEWIGMRIERRERTPSLAAPIAFFVALGAALVVGMWLR